MQTESTYASKDSFAHTGVLSVRYEAKIQSL